MEMNISRQRRLVFGTSIGLIAYQIGGGSLDTLKLLDGGVVISDPSHILTFAYIGLGYLVWRYWLYTKSEHSKFGAVVGQRLNKQEKFAGFRNDRLADFRAKSGIALVEGYQQIDDGDQSEIIQVPITDQIHYPLFRRYLIISVEDPKGDYNPNHVRCPVPFALFETSWTAAFVKAILSDHVFSDLFPPYIAAGLAFVLYFYRGIAI